MTSASQSWIGLDLEGGRYHVVGLLGEGGMASIYKATDLLSGEPVVLKAGVGAMLVSAEMSGRAERPFGGRDVSVLVPAGLVQGGAALRLGPRASLELQGFVGVCSPRVGVRIDGRSVASFGQPFSGASLGLAVGVF